MEGERRGYYNDLIPKMAREVGEISVKVDNLTEGFSQHKEEVKKVAEKAEKTTEDHDGRIKTLEDTKKGAILLVTGFSAGASLLFTIIWAIVKSGFLAVADAIAKVGGHGL